MGKVQMSAKWIISSTFLPYTGEPIDFLLEDRETPISGTFADGRFHSRWADFSADQVQSWREANIDPAHAPIAAPVVAGRRAWVMTLKRLARRLLPARGGTASLRPSVPVESKVVTPPVRTVVKTSHASRRHVDSNQTAS
jgi:hypothetical protein